jgi:triacylglycerol lipase
MDEARHLIGRRPLDAAGACAARRRSGRGVANALLILALGMLFVPVLTMAEISHHNPVLLVHGIKDDARKMEPMARYLRSQGWDARAMSLHPSWGQKGLDVLAGQVADFVRANYSSHQRIDLVGFSMGGLVCRYYLQRLGGLDRVQRYVSISAPNRGSILAWLIQNPGCRQMRPGSAFLRDLATDARRLSTIEFTSLWTPYDAIIVPSHSSVMPEARNVKMQVLCHPLMVWQKNCMAEVAKALREPLKTQGEMQKQCLAAGSPFLR